MVAGTRLGPYEIVGLIGAGGMGEVYKATDTRLNRTVAIKILPPQFADPEHRARFEREARSIAGLSHPHICTLYDIGESPAAGPGQGGLFLVMEHLAGDTLAERLRKGPLPIDQALVIGAQIADALAVAHRSGIVHRDLKPANVILTKSGVKLVDFGLARLRTPAVTPALALTATQGDRLTGRGTVLGTLHYMAPEQIEGRDVDARADIWALGLVLYEMSTGKHAFEGHSSASVIAAILERQPVSLGQLQPLAPVALERLVSRCLAKDPEQRWDSAHDVADALRWVAESTPDKSGAVQSARPSRPVQRLAVKVAGIVVVASLAGATLWFAMSRRHTVSPTTTAIRSIAVLPLENLSRDETQEFFADGLTDALITELAHVRSLRVISRTSVMRYKKTRKPIAEIAHELSDVGAVLEGTVMRVGDRVAITVQLIDASRDQHLWSQTYERDVSDILSLRRDIAQTVAREIRTATEGDANATRPTPKVNPAAFDQYLRSITAENAGDSRETGQAALAAAQAAVRLDPGFAAGYAALSEANAKVWWYYWDHSPIRVAEARAAADKAVALDPQLGEAHRAKGYVYYWIDLDYAAALGEFTKALDLNPSDSRSLMGVASVYRRQGRTQDAARSLETAIALNPQDATLYFNLGETYTLLRRPEDADKSLDHSLAVAPYGRPFAYKMRWRLRLRPNFTQAQEIEKRADAAGFGADPIVLYHRVLLHTYSGDPTGSLQLLASMQQDAFDEQFWFVPRNLLAGQAYEALGDKPHSRVNYDRARQMLETKLKLSPGDSRLLSALGITLASIGEADAGILQGKAAVQAMPVAREAYRGAYRLEDLARIYALAGRRDDAVEILRQVLAMADDLSAAGVLVDPTFRTLHGHAGFDALMAQHGASSR